jgi:hypothetical protein
MKLRPGAILALATATLLAFAGGFTGAVLTGAEEATELRFEDVRRQTEEFIGYHRELRLTDDQQRVFEEALDALPAPCCRDRTATTCCCACNMARSWWGLAKHLIAERGMAAEEVRTKVSEWIEFIHPDGYAGDACYRGRCGRPFRHDGCGGMRNGEVIY